jgi:hypothetical protein
MIRLRQLILGSAFALAALAASAQPQFPTEPNSSAAAITLLPMPPPVPQIQSPVTFFRQLLAMSPSERIISLTNRTPETRARIMAKVHEYLVLSPDERELRLRSTELRWYLTPLFRMAPADREPRLALVPDDMRALVKSRLTQWDLLPPPLQQEFLANDRALHYFAHIETTNSATTSSEQQTIAGQFNQIFELTPEEKQQALKTLSNAERAQMEKTLQAFGQLPPRQRLLCVKNYARFTGMSPAERADFLKNAQRWSQMSPQERQTWRDLVANVPLWPPLPPTILPPNLIPPHPPLKLPRPNVATN